MDIQITNFIINGYEFKMISYTKGEQIYKVSPIIDNPTKDTFNYDIIENEEICTMIGLNIGYVIKSKSSYFINDTSDNKMYMILLLEISTPIDYEKMLFPNDTAEYEQIYKDFYPYEVMDKKYPLLLNIQRIFDEGANKFNSAYFMNVTIGNTEDILRLEPFLQEYIFDIIDDIVNLYINPNRTYKIGFRHNYVRIASYNQLKFSGYLIPNSINDIRINEISENTITIQEDEKWCGEETINESSTMITNVIPYIMDTTNIKHEVINILKTTYFFDNNKKYYNLNFQTNIHQILDGTLSELMTDDDNIFISKYTQIYENDVFTLFKNKQIDERYSHIGYCESNVLNSSMVGAVTNFSKFIDRAYGKDVDIVILSRTGEYSCFGIINNKKKKLESNKPKKVYFFKTIYDYIVRKIKREVD